MAIKPIDITSKNFSSKMKGYNKDEVNDFLDEIALEFEKLIAENRDLEKNAKQAEEKLIYFNDLKDSLNQSILVAQDTADKLKENATKESDLAIQQAQAQSEDILAHATKMSDELITGSTNKANEILTEASERARQLAVETDDLKKKTRVFHRNLSVLLESQLQIVKSDEWDELLKPFGAYVESSHQAFKEVLDAVEIANSPDPTPKAVEATPNFSVNEVHNGTVTSKKDELGKETTTQPKKENRPERASRSRVK